MKIYYIPPKQSVKQSLEKKKAFKDIWNNSMIFSSSIPVVAPIIHMLADHSTMWQELNPSWYEEIPIQIHPIINDCGNAPQIFNTSSTFLSQQLGIPFFQVKLLFIGTIAGVTGVTILRTYSRLKQKA